MLAFANMMKFLTDELTGLGGRRFAFLLVFSSSFDGFFFRHDSSLLRPKTEPHPGYCWPQRPCQKSLNGPLIYQRYFATYGAVNVMVRATSAVADPVGTPLYFTRGLEKY